MKNSLWWYKFYKIDINNEKVKITDNNSTNGIYVNDNLIANDAIIKSGDKLQIGKFQLLFTKV